MAHVVTKNGVVELVRYAGGFRIVHEDGSLLGDWSASEGLQYPQEFSEDFAVVSSACVRSWFNHQPKTIRVRIAVAAGDDGKWCATGDWEYSDEMNGNEATESLRRQIGYPEHGVMVHFIEATVPLPESVTVEGEVKP